MQHEVCQVRSFCHRTDMLLQVSDVPFMDLYGTGVVAGNVSQDTISLGSPALVLQAQAFGDALQISADFVGVSCDGLFVSLAPLLCNSCTGTCSHVGSSCVPVSIWCSLGCSA